MQLSRNLGSFCMSITRVQLDGNILISVQANVSLSCPIRFLLLLLLLLLQLVLFRVECLTLSRLFLSSSSRFSQAFKNISLISAGRASSSLTMASVHRSLSYIRSGETYTITVVIGPALYARQEKYVAHTGIDVWQRHFFTIREKNFEPYMAAMISVLINSIFQVV